MTYGAALQRDNNKFVSTIDIPLKAMVVSAKSKYSKPQLLKNDERRET